MESLRLSIEAVAPIFLMMSLGYVLKCLKLTDKKGFDVMNKFVFKVFLPLLLFYNIYKTETLEIFDSKLIGFTAVGVLAVFVLGYFSVLLISKENPKRGVILQGFFRSNFAILGIPLVDYICGDEVTGLTSLMVAVVIPLYNVLAVVALERFKETDESMSLWRLVKGVITNPLIIGCAFGAVFLCLGIKLPNVLEKPVRDISSVATPLAIICLGAGFEFSGVKGYVREIVIVVLSRLVIIPLILMPIAVMLGFSGEALACLLVTFAAPIAVSSFSMTQQMGGDEKLSAQTIVLSSAFCIITLFLWIFALSSFGLF